MNYRTFSTINNFEEIFGICVLATESAKDIMVSSIADYKSKIDGKLIEPRYGHYWAAINLNGKRVSFSISVKDYAENANECIKQLSETMKSAEKLKKTVAEAIIKDNDAWDEDFKDMTLNTAISTLYLESISISQIHDKSSKFFNKICGELWFADGGIYGGHVLIIHQIINGVPLKEGFTLEG